MVSCNVVPLAVFTDLVIHLAEVFLKDSIFRLCEAERAQSLEGFVQLLHVLLFGLLIFLWFDRTLGKVTVDKARLVRKLASFFVICLFFISSGMGHLLGNGDPIESGGGGGRVY